MDKLKKEFKKNQHIIINSVAIGIAIGLLIFAIYRFVSYTPPKHTHYHANFVVYANGTQDKFSDPNNYQEIASCTKDEENNPLHRAHMHDGIYDVVHVHADAVTWNQFLENINIFADTTYLRLNNQSKYSDLENKLTIILNGKKIDSLSGLVIYSEDNLLINYGNENEETILQRYTTIENKAKIYNETKDPASCSGDEHTTFGDRLNNIFK